MSEHAFTQYRVMVQAFTALSIARPVTIIAPNAHISIGETKPQGCAVDWCWLVADQDQVYGYLTQQIIDEADDVEPCAAEMMKPLGRHSVVPASMPLLNLIPRLAKQDDWTLFVLTDAGITHVVTGEEYDSMPVKLCLFALILELEEEMLYVLRSQPDRLGQRLAHLGPKRRSGLAKSLRVARWRTDDPLLVLKWTNILDKEQMLYRDPMTRRLFDFTSDPDEFFNRVRLLRNAIAHNEPLTEAGDDLPVPEYFERFLSDLQRAILRFATERQMNERHGDAALN